MILLTILFLIVGLFCLFIGAKFLVISLENIAIRLGISQLLMGLTILAIGTSLPEIAVSVMGGIDKVTGISTGMDGIVIGNKVGSFFTNITLILGILGLSQAIFVSKWELKREGTMMIISVLIFVICSLDGYLSRIDAIAMIIIYIIYLLFTVKGEKKRQRAEAEIKAFLAKRDGVEKEVVQRQVSTSIKRDVVFMSIGLVILLIGAEITLLASVNLAIALDMPEIVIGILIVGLGTSLPELVADLTALRRDSSGIAIGDILGSNICNILFAAGSGAIISEFEVPISIILFDIPMLLIAIILTLYFLWTKNSLKRWESALLISFYGCYVLLKLLFFQI